MKEPLRKRFGKVVKALRLASGVSQEAFADQCGLARSYQSRIERGGANPSLDAIEALADALGVDVKILFETTTARAMIKPAAPVLVPFAADGTCFNPGLRRKRTGKFTVGKKSAEQQFETFEAALEHLRSMEKACWRRPNAVGDSGIVTAVRWATLPKKY